MALEGGEGSASRLCRSLPPGKDPVPIVQEAGWAPGPVWTGAENLVHTVIRSPDCPARSQSLYRLNYPGNGSYMTAQNIRTVDSVANKILRRCHACLLPQGNTRYPLYRRLGGTAVSVWTGSGNIAHNGIRSPYRPACSQSLYRLSYPAPGYLNSPVIILPHRITLL